MFLNEIVFKFNQKKKTQNVFVYSREKEYVCSPFAHSKCFWVRMREKTTRWNDAHMFVYFMSDNVFNVQRCCLDRFLSLSRGSFRRSRFLCALNLPQDEANFTSRFDVNTLFLMRMRAHMIDAKCVRMQCIHWCNSVSLRYRITFIALLESNQTVGSHSKPHALMHSYEF